MRPETELHSPARPKILVVDDQVTNIRVLHQLLKDKHEVFMARSGREALKVCQDKKVDLILLDVEMQGLDGFETCRILKEQQETQDIPIIFVTGHRAPEVETRCLQAGAVDFVAKPINAPVLLARIHTHLLLAAQANYLRTMAFTDGLTGIGNRRSFDLHLAHQLRACRRNELGLGVVLIDVDHFKNFNDHYGHIEGDRALCSVGDALRGALRRPDDFLARYGGEEFAVVVPDADPKGIEQISEKLRASVEQIELLHAKSSAAEVVTISVGCTVSVPTSSSVPAEFLTTADQALYQAKLAGRNRVCRRELEDSEAEATVALVR